MEELKNYGHQHPLLMLNEEQLLGNGNGVVDCSRCGEKMSAPCFSCVKCCGFYLHKTCAQAPLELNHPFHRHHPLLLLQNPPYTPYTWCVCDFCNEACEKFIYHCSCGLDFHIKCALFTFNIAERNLKELEHVALEDPSFSSKNNGGNLGKCFACWEPLASIMLHKKRISLPRIIQHLFHVHRVFHTYFIRKEYFESLNCIWCHEVVDTEHGSYFCADCNVIFHVNCALQERSFEMNDAVEATVIEHCEHKHYLMLSDKISEHGDKCCDGCLLLISAKFYHCLRCDFFLHKSCAESPKMKLFSKHICGETQFFSGSKPFILTSDCMFRCGVCEYLSNGFSYKCNECGEAVCLRCLDLYLQDAVKIPGHKHPLLFYYDYEELCSACGRDIIRAFRCKGCNLHLCNLCVIRPTRVRNKCDEHILALTNDKVNDYAKYHYCDICEKERDPKHWFYHCETCDTSVHMDCVLGKYSFIKLGSTYNEGNHEHPLTFGDHPHPLTFVKKVPYYPECVECGKPCEDIFLEYAEPGCKYVAHWECRKSAIRGRC
ncbi:hypothetical protein ES332_D13G009100v1 [Gossypium tomentosum]|uniref:DC1 domain-containing protein n=1 Tax=Gossypium tomentosum TaxID=34277 RepID=A0A5D2HRW1_GOSTO|nr:hypothetical protein ES332_D13G009100v1 [Gossypium tomentosum]